MSGVTTHDGVSPTYVAPAIYRRAAQPDSTIIGDLWEDTSTDPPVLKHYTIGGWAAVGGAGSPAWGAITGTLSAQTDLQSALDLKAPLASPTFTGTVGGITAAMVGAPAGSGTSSGSNTGDQTSIVGIAGTLAQFNTACTDADFASGGGTATGSNTGDNATNSQYSGLVSNATHTGDATGATALIVVRINGTALSGLATGLLKNTTGTGVPSIAVNSDLPAMSATVGGAVPTPPNNTTTFLRGDGTFAAPTASAAWGGITGTLSAQADLQAALDAKQATLVSGTTIKTINGSTVLGSGDLAVTASNPSYAPGLFTVATETWKLLGNHVKLTTTQRATLQGTGRLRVSN